MEKQGSYRRLVFSNAVILVATLLACETYGNYVFGVRIDNQERGFETIWILDKLDGCAQCGRSPAAFVKEGTRSYFPCGWDGY